MNDIEKSSVFPGSYGHIGEKKRGLRRIGVNRVKYKFKVDYTNTHLYFTLCYKHTQTLHLFYISISHKMILMIIDILPEGVLAGACVGLQMNCLL